MTCRDFVEFLIDYLAGELSSEQMARFKEHLADCPDCIAYVQSYRETIRAGQAAYAQPDDPVPADVPEDLIQAILAARRQGS